MGFFDRVMRAMGFVPVKGGIIEPKNKPQDPIARFIIEAEDTMNNAYKDAGGALTVGVGHLILKNDQRIVQVGADPNMGTALFLTDEQCFELLKLDLVSFRQELNKALRVDTTETEYDALLSLVFNIGSKQFNMSTLLSLINSREYKTKEALAEQFMKWNKVNTRVVTGLSVRRAAEATIFLGKKVIPDNLIKGFSLKSKQRSQQLVDVYNGR